ncbi:hypothetical protein Btru_038814 [Bulinus truncatus]|nr:hypothetical protein Btru_038814 [Bulinus truncatus]
MPGTAFSSEKGLCTWRHLVPECRSDPRAIPKAAATTSATRTPSPQPPTTATATSASTSAPSTSGPQRLRNTTPAVQTFKRTETKSARNAVAQANPESMVPSEPYQANHEDSSSTTGIQDFQCPSVLDGFYRDNLFCDIFHRCVLGTRFTFTCPTGTFFRMEGNLCDFWETVSDCTQDGIRLEAINSLPEVAPEPSPLPVPNPGPSEVDVDVINNDSEPTPCPASSGLFAHPRNCKQFLFCAHNVPLVLTCPETLLYNSQTLTCDFAKNVRCIRYDHYQK